MALWDDLARAVATRRVEAPPQTMRTATEAHARAQTRLRAILAPDNVLAVQGRAGDDFPSFDEQLAVIMREQTTPWRPASITEALGVPAIFGAVTLISKTIGSMAMRALRNEVELPPDERPRVIIRPDPFIIPSEYYASLGFNLATTGEAWLWIAKRDATDGSALSVISVPPHEIMVEENQRDLLHPLIQWRGVTMPNDDMKQIVFHRRSRFALRGVGPLQLCGAALSIAVESQEWAANFFADGSHAPLIIRSAVELADDPNDPNGLSEAERLALDWGSKGNNRPRVIDPRIEGIDQLDYNTAGAQMLDAREHEVGDVARMFSIPGSLLDYAVSGSSITYQNLESQYDDFLRRCLRPNYLRPIEETMSDLLSRSTVARFDTEALTLADVKTRFDVYNVAIPLGVLSVEEARGKEGLAPGDTDNAPVPFSPPVAIPDRLPIDQPTFRTAHEPVVEVRCTGTKVAKGVMTPCNRLLGRAAGSFELLCPRCGKLNVA